MISASDSFISYLSAQLAGTPPVFWVRPTAEDNTSHEMKLNALNVSVLMFTEAGTSERVLVSLDLIGNNERQVINWAKLVRDVLIQQQYAQEADHEANPGSPVSLNRFVFWDGRDIQFDLVSTAAHYVHLNATFEISHTRQ